MLKPNTQLQPFAPLLPKLNQPTQPVAPLLQKRPFQVNTQLNNTAASGGLLQKIGAGVENFFGAPAFSASGGNPLTGKGGNVPRGFSDQVTEATKPILGKYAPVAGMAAGFMEPLGSFGKIPKGLEAAARAIKATQDVNETAKILKTVGFADNLIQTHAPVLTLMNDEKSIAQSLLKLEAVQKKTPNVHDILKEVQEKSPNLQHGRAYDIADRARTLSNPSSFVDSELANINPKTLPSYPPQIPRATAPLLKPNLAPLTASQEKTTQLLPKQQGQTIQTLNQLPHIGEKVTKNQGVLAQSTVTQPLLAKRSSLPGNVAQPFDPAKYVAEQLMERKIARGEEGILAKTKSFLGNIKSKLVDFAAPIEDTLAAATKKHSIKLQPTEDIKNQIDRVLRAPTLAGQFAKDHGIVDVIQKVDNIDNLDQYLIAKHALELDTRGIATGRDIAKDQQLIKAFSPQYEALAKKVSMYSQGLLDYSVETGLVSKELAATLKTRYPDYVPFQRVFDEVHQQGHGGGIASIGKQTAVQKITGSEREIESPITSLLAKTNDVFKQGEKNLAAKMLAGYEKLPDNPFQLKEIGGFIDDKTGRKIFTEGDNAKDTISFFDKGEKRMFSTTPEIAAAAKALNVQQLNILGKILALPTRIARIGITGVNLPFIASNIAKDQVTAFINSNHSLRSSVANPVVFLKSLVAAAGHGKLYDEWIRAGGGGTSFDISRNQAEHTVESIRAGQNIGTKILYTAKHPSELLRAVENIVGRSEELTRLQQFAGAKEGLLKKGMDAKNAIAGAAAASRENTVNFARRGEWGTVLNSAFLYLNASIQGTRTLLRNLQTKPVQTAAKIAMTAMFPVATATAWNLSDPERKKAYEDIAEYEKENNIIIVPPNPTQDARGKWNVIKIPLSQEINNLVGMARKPLEQMYGLDPVSFGDVAKALIGIVSPINPTKGSLLSTLTPQAIKPWIEASTNRNLFTGNPQVSESLSRLSPELQVKPYTSGTARKIAGIVGASPIKTEETIKGFLGGVGSQALNFSDRALATTGVIPKDQIGGQDILGAITGRFDKAQGGAIADKAYQANAQSDQQHADEIAVAKRKITKEGDYQFVGSTMYAMVNGEVVDARVSDPSKAPRKVLELQILSNIKSDDARRAKLDAAYKYLQSFKGTGSWTKAERARMEARLKSLPLEIQAELQVYGEYISGERAKNTTQVRDLMYPNPSDAISFLRGLPKEEQARIVKLLTDDEKAQLRKGL